MDRGYLKFTGKYAELKNMGYKFQKLYASNYMSWNRNSVFIFKKGSDITHCEIDLYQLVKLLRTNPVTKCYGGPGSVSFLVFYNSDGTREYRDYSEENVKLYHANINEWRNYNSDTDEAPQLISTTTVDAELIEQLEELNRLGWYELATYDD